MSFEISCLTGVVYSTALMSNNLASLRGKQCEVFGQGSASCARDAPCFSVRTRWCAHTYLPCQRVLRPWHSEVLVQALGGEGRAEGFMSLFVCLGNCLCLSLSKQNASFSPVGTTFPSPLGGLFMQVFICSVVGCRQLSRELGKTSACFTLLQGGETSSQSLGFGKLKRKMNVKKERK